MQLKIFMEVSDGILMNFLASLGILILKIVSKTEKNMIILIQSQ